MHIDYLNYKMEKYFFVWAFLWIVLASIPACVSQEIQVVYKSVDSTDLQLDIYYPSDTGRDTVYPAMVFFFGGGWNGGNVNQFKNHAQYFAKRGIVCFLADYRVKSRQGTSPFEALEDAKSAIRYVRKNAGKHRVDPDKIIASGGSAGGHLAAATALIDDLNATHTDSFVSCIPNALVLFNPVIDNGPGGYGFERIGSKYKDFSPLHNIHQGAPPTIIFLGTKDRLIPVETVQYYKVVMEKVGSRCDVHLYEGEGHGFFNFSQQESYQATVREADCFLRSLGYIHGKPNIR